MRRVMDETVLPTLCPECGVVLQQGYGLLGGGFGAYVYCDEHGVIGKVQEDAGLGDQLDG
jgi:hypothetical protein